MGTDDLVKILRCGDASTDEQEQAADELERLIAEVERLDYRLASSRAMSRRTYGQS
jgi:hypothetical protein